MNEQIWLTTREATESGAVTRKDGGPLGRKPLHRRIMRAVKKCIPIRFDRRPQPGGGVPLHFYPFPETAELLKLRFDRNKAPRAAECVPESAVGTEPAPHDFYGFKDPDNETYWSEPDYDSEQVVVSWPGLRSPIAVPFRIDREIQQAYTREGENRTRRDIAESLGLDFNGLAKYLRARGITKDSPTFADWELTTLEDSELSATIERRRLHKVKARQERERVRRLTRYEQTRDQFELWAEEAGRAVCEHLRQLPRISVPAWHAVNGGDVVDVIIPETDAHIDAQPYDGEGHIDYAQRLNRMRGRLLRRVLAAGCTVRRIVMMVGSDWLNADNWNTTTTKGTQQTNDLPRADVMPYAVNALVTAIETYRNVAPVDLCLVDGNHDRYGSRWLWEVIRGVYGHSYAAKTVGVQAAKDVTFHDDRDSSGGATGRVWIRLGATLVCLTHGDRAGITDGAKLWTIALRERPDCVDGTRRVLCVHGDGHVERWTPHGEALTIQAPGTSPTSDWAVRKFGRLRESWIALGLLPHGTPAYRWAAELDEETGE